MAGPPDVRWYDKDSIAEVVGGWDAGTVDAGGESVPAVFHIWNNKGGAETLSDMQDVTITTKSYVPGDEAASGKDEGPVATKSQASVFALFETDAGWISSLGNGVYEEVGGSDTAVVYSRSGVAGIIKGTLNNGDVLTNKANYSKVKLKLVAKADAAAGQIWWLTRFSYKYV